jgi:hypothetical protein
MTKAIKARTDVAFENPVGSATAAAVWPAKDFVTFIHGIRTTAFQPKALGVAVGQGFREGIETKQVQSLHGPIGHRRYPQGTLLAVALG